MTPRLTVLEARAALLTKLAAWRCPVCRVRHTARVASTRGRIRHIKCCRAGCPGTGKISL